MSWSAHSVGDQSRSGFFHEERMPARTLERIIVASGSPGVFTADGFLVPWLAIGYSGPGEGPSSPFTYDFLRAIQTERTWLGR